MNNFLTVGVEKNPVNMNYRQLMKKFIEDTAVEIFDYNQYELNVKVEPNDLVLDLGCSLGYFYFKNSRKNITYIGVDGSIDCLKDFYENLNNDNNPILINSFVTDNKKIYDCKPFFHDTPSKEVVSISFVDLIKMLNKKIDFLKFDIEGAEMDFFNNELNYKLLKQHIKKFSGEFHLLNESYTRQKINEVLKKLSIDPQLDLKIHSIDGFDITNSYFDSGDYYSEIIISSKVNNDI
jgi:SAM-dependent methyltransferase